MGGGASAQESKVGGRIPALLRNRVAASKNVEPPTALQVLVELAQADTAVESTPNSLARSGAAATFHGVVVAATSCDTASDSLSSSTASTAASSRSASIDSSSSSCHLEDGIRLGELRVHNVHLYSERGSFAVGSGRAAVMAARSRSAPRRTTTACGKDVTSDPEYKRAFRLAAVKASQNQGTVRGKQASTVRGNDRRRIRQAACQCQAGRSQSVRRIRST